MQQINLEEQALEYKNNLYKTYIASKNLFIRAEEQLEQMSFFVAPMIEHRDALDHIMRYFEYKNSEGLSEKAIKELDRALEHELRAYFDIADFVCITVRQEIATSLKGVSSRKIKKIWSDYVLIKQKISNVSNELAEIRQNRGTSLEHLEKYMPVMDEVLEIYDFYNINIEPKIRKVLFFRK